MKKILLLELCLLFLATNFQSDNPPGWYQQTLPVNDFVNDIFFIDSLNGWIVTDGHTNNNDTGYIMRTSNGGDNWMVQFSQNLRLTTVYFTDLNTGYAGGGSGSGTVYMFKTTNGGDTWSQIIGTTGGTQVDDMFFINSDTGWYCDNNSLDGGLYKTTNGGINWSQQLNNSFKPMRMSFINADTGWMGNNTGVLYKTSNGGTNWIQVYDFPDVFGVLGVKFINSSTGWLTTAAIYKSTNGGLNWEQYGGSEIGAEYSFVSESTGWASSDNNRVVKTTNAGQNWFYQNVPIFNSMNIFAIDSLRVWAGGTGIIHTTNGGVTSVQQSGNQIPDEYSILQNFPNPFNPTTKIKFNIHRSALVNLSVYDVTGKEVTILVNEELSAGEYEHRFDGTHLTSGVYFYRLQAGEFSSTKKMMLIK